MGRTIGTDPGRLVNFLRPVLRSCLSGEGTFGKVKLGRHFSGASLQVNTSFRGSISCVRHILTGERVAVKVLEKDRIQEAGLPSDLEDLEYKLRARSRKTSGQPLKNAPQSVEKTQNSKGDGCVKS